jgi:hypothetical protein
MNFLNFFCLLMEGSGSGPVQIIKRIRILEAHKPTAFLFLYGYDVLFLFIIREQRHPWMVEGLAQYSLAYSALVHLLQEMLSTATS